MSNPPSTIASAYLEKKDRDSHKIWFSQEFLQIFYRGRLRVFEMEQISRISFNHRKLMLPLIFGGIAASLAFVAIFKVYYNPWLMLTILCAGCLSAYVGFMGRNVLTIEEPKNYSDFFLKTISPELKAFVRYANTFTGRQPKGMLYLPVPFPLWQKARETGYLIIPEPNRLYFPKETGFMPKEGMVVLPVPTLEENVYVTWKTTEDSDDDLHPFLEKNSQLSLQDIKPLYRE